MDQNENIVLDVTQREFKVIRFKEVEKKPYILEYIEFENDRSCNCSISKLIKYLNKYENLLSICFDKNLDQYEINTILQTLKENNIKYDNIYDDIEILAFPSFKIENGWLNLNENRYVVLNKIIWNSVNY